MMLLMILGLIIYVIFWVLEFITPIALVYCLIVFPDNNLFWVWAILLVVWFVSRAIVYIVKEIR